MTILQPPTLKLDATLYKDLPPMPRVKIERRIVWNLLHYLEAAGFHVEAVGGDVSTSVVTPMDAMELLKP